MTSRNSDPAYLPTAVPTPRQLEYQDWEMGAFFHFGIRTFYEGHRDWDGEPMPLEAFNPAQLDCEDWTHTAREAGMAYAVLVCKHHDGFANWPSRSSTYGVAHTPWKDGGGDVVGEFVHACRRQGLKVGLYYSPAEWGNPTFEDEAAYDQHFLGQVSELLTNYGEIDILWFDGCGSQGHRYDWARIIGEVRRLQPDILIFNMGDPDFRWVGNESGMAPLPNWNTVAPTQIASLTDARQQAAGQGLWLPAECDCMMRWSNWFYEDADAHTVKPLEELMGLYMLSVGRGANLLINIGPDRRGLLPDPDRQRLLELGDEIRRRLGSPFATITDGLGTHSRWEFATDEPFYLDHVVLQEELTEGEAVRRFAVRIQPGHGASEIILHEGRNMGHKAICRLPLVAARKVVVEIMEADRPARLRNVELHNATGLVHQH
ncbi:MAG: alpha-L-fucosidase [Candidatus Brocadiia bacterium]